MIRTLNLLCIVLACSMASSIGCDDSDGDADADADIDTDGDADGDGDTE